MRRAWRMALVVAVGCVLPWTARADHIVMQDGRTYDGEVAAEDAATVTLDISGPGYTLTKRLDKSQIKSWPHVVHEGPPYVSVPVIGRIGDDVTVDALRAGLDKAASAHPQFLVVAIDSDGGDVEQTAQMIQLLTNASSQTRVVAYVKRAYGPAAVVAMSCGRIYLTPDGAIGALPAYQTPRGQAAAQARLQSIAAAQARAAAVHDRANVSLALRGLAEPGLEIFLAHEDGEPVLRTKGGGRVVKAKDQPLMLGPEGAAACGLAQTANDMTDLGRKITGGPWFEASHSPWKAVVDAAALRREQIEQQQRQVRRDKAIARVKPQWDTLDHRIAVLQERSDAANAKIAQLRAKCDSDLRQIESQYQQAASLNPGDVDNVVLSRVQQRKEAHEEGVRQQLAKAVAPLEAESREALAQIARIRSEQEQLLAKLPPN